MKESKSEQKKREGYQQISSESPEKKYIFEGDLLIINKQEKKERLQL